MFLKDFELTKENMFRGKLIQFKRKSIYQLFVASFCIVEGIHLINDQMTFDFNLLMILIGVTFLSICILWFLLVKFVWIPLRYKKLLLDLKIHFRFQIDETGRVILSYPDSKTLVIEAKKVRVSKYSKMYIFSLGIVNRIPLYISISENEFSSLQTGQLKKLFNIAV